MAPRSRPFPAAAFDSPARLQGSVPDVEVRPRDRRSQAVVSRVLLHLHPTSTGIILQLLPRCFRRTDWLEA